MMEPKLLGIMVTEGEIIAFLLDGRSVSVPLAWSWRLSDATPEQRNHYEIIGDGQGIHWPDIDEDISVVMATLLAFSLPREFSPRSISLLRSSSLS
ncbi:MAG: DUF2442 domain-containing protein [Thermodesulfobacteriota bacterium]